mgnify:CR=1 FL=1
MKTDDKNILKIKETQNILPHTNYIINKNDFYNYPPQTDKKKEKLYTKIFIAIIYFALVICIEQLYRETLFDKSIDTQEDIREDHNKESAFYDFWKVMSVFGTASITFPVFFVIFLFFPISSSFLTLQSLIYSAYLTNLLKIIYRNGRPYWESELLDVVCNSGYGNPSGHSVTSTAYYLTLPHIVTNFPFFSRDIKGRIVKFIIFILFIILAVLVMCSRVILAAHAINQVLYGFTLGLGIYLVLIYILSYHTYSPDKFLNHITNKIVVLIYMIFHIAITVLLIVIYFTIDDNKRLKYEIYTNIFNGIRCKEKKKYLVLKYDGFFQALAIVAILGAHLGIILLIQLLKVNNYIINGAIIEFNKSSVKRWLLRLPILIVSGVLILLYYLVPGGKPLAIIFIFKSALSFFLTAFGIYFVGIFISILCNLANEEIKRN